MSNLPRIVVSTVGDEVRVVVRYIVQDKIARETEFAIDRGHLVATLKALLSKEESMPYGCAPDEA